MGLKDVVYYELLYQGKTINFEKYCNQFDKLKDAIAEKLKIDESIRSSRQCKSHVVLTVNIFSIPDLALSDYYLFCY